MKETLLITDEAYRGDMEKLWRVVRRLRDSTQYSNVTFTMQNWMLACDGEKIKHGLNQGLNITDLLFRLPLAPTNSELIEFMKAANVDVATELPAHLTFTVDVEYTRLS